MGKWYYLNASLEKVGPISSQALKALASNGVINQLTTLISEDGTKMYEAGNIKGLFTESDPFAPGNHQQDVPTSALPMPAQKTVISVSPPPLPPPVQTQPPFPDAWDSGFEFPSSLQSSGPAIERQPMPQRRSANRFFSLSGFRSEFIIVLLFLSVLVKIATIALSARPGYTVSVAAVLKKHDSSDFPGGDLKPRPMEEAPNSPSKPTDDVSTGSPPVVTPAIPKSLPPRERSAPVTPRRNAAAPSEEKKATWFDDEPTSATPSVPSEREKKPTPSEEDQGVSGGAKPFIPDEPFETVVMEPLPPLQPPRVGARSVEEIVADAEGSVTLISGKNGSGSGFVVLPGIIATNSHVINSEEIAELEIFFPSADESKKGPFKATLLYEDVDRDLALLRIPSKEHEAIPIVRDYKFRRGQRVIAIGNPGRGDGNVLENAVCEGILSTQTVLDDQPYYQLSIAINQGNSGGPILDDAGNVLGVATLKATKTEAMAYCVPPDALNLAIESLRQTDAEKIRQANERHRSLLALNRGIEKLAVVISLPPAVLENPPEAIRELAREALVDFDEAVRRLPDDVRAFAGRAVFRLVLNDFPGAYADLDVAVRLEPEKQEIVDFREAVRREMEQRHQIADGHSQPRTPIRPITMDDMNRLRPPGAVRPPGPPPFGRQNPREMFRSQLGLDESPIPNSPSRQVPEETEENRALREARYRQILAKEEWIFQGSPIRGTIVGYSNGVVQLKPRDATEGTRPIERYANRFSPEDFEDIRFYARYHGIPFNIQRRR